ncbi:MAG: CDP-glucose 4,6-dehydratase [Pseudomonadota bacterium]
MARLPDPAFWRSKRVLLTGHTGFKGSWAALWLRRMGADVTGIGLAPESEANHFALADAADGVDSRIADLRDRDEVAAIVAAARPDLVLHMAAQPLVRRSIRDPHTTWSTNVGGTASLLDALLAQECRAPVLVVTSDKVYANDGSGRAFAEDDRLGDKDPYSASKAACELLVRSYRATYFGPASIPIATARAGNVIGGGDFSEDRIVPDIVRAALAGKDVVLRHPEATRPWQHVLDCLAGYLVYLETLALDPAAPPTLNLGPDPEREITVAQATETVASLLDRGTGWVHEPVPGSIEAKSLGLDSTLARRVLDWADRLPGQDALDWTAEWYAAWLAGEALPEVSRRQIDRYLEL